MKLGAVPESLVDRLLVRTNLAPRPMLETHVAALLARAVLEGSHLGLFAALADGALPAGEVAARCGTDPAATRKLLDALAGARYLRHDAGRYALEPVARKWLLPGAAHSMHDMMLWQLRVWDQIAATGEYVRTGRPVDFHATLEPEQWGAYQRAMRDMARTLVPEVARRTPVPKGARDLLDIGGSHGLFSVALCRRHPSLRAVVLDLPEAVAEAAPLLAAEGMGDRVVHRAGDALREDLGEESWDVVLIASLVHHFDEATNRDLARRVARALRPGGIYVIQDFMRPHSPEESGQIGALLDLYFAVTSEVGTWSFEDLAGWQREAGLAPKKPVRFLTSPGTGQQAAVKTRARTGAP
jgi:SAM-dependent methyltransferase